jgi:hypothetical protein
LKTFELAIPLRYTGEKIRAALWRLFPPLSCIERKSMSSTHSKRLAISLAAAFLFASAAACWTAYSQETKARAKPRGRLPSYYGDVVTQEQRDAIYKIQESYESQLAALREQLKALVAKRDAEVQAVLSPEQREQVKRLAAEAKAEREAELKLKAESESAPADAAAP